MNLQNKNKPHALSSNRLVTKRLTMKQYIMVLMFLTFSVITGSLNASEYYILNPNISNSPLGVVGLQNGTTVTVGSTTLNLNQFQVGSIPILELTQGALVSSSQAFDVGSESSATDLLVPSSFAGSTFIIPHGIAADLDGDGVLDNLDNCKLMANTNQVDADSDGYGNICDADLDNNGIVNIDDYFILATAFFTPDPIADLNVDGIVNIDDYFILATAFFTAPGPSAQENVTHTYYLFSPTSNATANIHRKRPVIPPTVS